MCGQRRFLTRLSKSNLLANAVWTRCLITGSVSFRHPIVLSTLYFAPRFPIALTNCGRNARRKIDSFGLKDVDQYAYAGFGIAAALAGYIACTSAAMSAECAAGVPR